MDFNQFLTNLITWFFSSGIKIISVLVAAFIITKINKIIILKVVSTFIKKGGKIIKNGKIQEERIKTLTGVFNSSLKTMVWILAILTVLPELNINIGPLLAGLGIVGLALGMGARNLIQDYLSGIFILMEDHYRVGEVVTLVGIKGKVVDLNLRRTVIKDEEGTFHTFPNGQINKSSNFSRSVKK